MKHIKYPAVTLILLLFAASMAYSQEGGKPKFYYTPKSITIGLGEVYSDVIFVTDKDLFDKNQKETIKFNSVTNDNIIFDPDSVMGPYVDDSGNPLEDTLIQVLLRCGAVYWDHDENYVANTKISATDKQGQMDIISIPVRLHEPMLWKCKMEVINPKNSKFILVFGQANNATTGAGNDGAPQGKLDVMYAESELAPADSIKGFDARWTIPSTNGTLWNILPPADNPAFYGSSIDLTSKSDKDTVTFKWYRFDVPDQSDAAKNPKGLKWFICDGETGGAIFKYDMRSLSTIVNADGASEIEIGRAHV